MVESSIQSSSSSSSSKLQELLCRVEELEWKRFSTSFIIDNSNNNNNMNIRSTGMSCIDESIRRARYAVETQSTYCYSAIWQFVPTNYYERSLQERAQCLPNAPSIHYLCKSLLLENRKVVPTFVDNDTNNNNDPTNPRFVLVILQYTSILDYKKLISTIRRQLRTTGTSTSQQQQQQQQRLDSTTTQFDFRIATEIDNATITGYTHNSVTPFGMQCHSKSQQPQPQQHVVVPIILSSALIPLKFIWMGGGHEHLKLGISVLDFCYAFNPIVADISRPRTTFATSIDDDNDENI